MVRVEESFGWITHRSSLLTSRKELIRVDFIISIHFTLYEKECYHELGFGNFRTVKIPSPIAHRKTIRIE